MPVHDCKLLSVSVWVTVCSLFCLTGVRVALGSPNDSLSVHYVLHIMQKENLWTTTLELDQVGSSPSRMQLLSPGCPKWKIGAGELSLAIRIAVTFDLPFAT